MRAWRRLADRRRAARRHGGRHPTLTLTLPLTLTLTLVPTPTLALNPNQVAGGVPPTAVSLNAAIFAAAVGGEWRRDLALL